MYAQQVYDTGQNSFQSLQAFPLNLLLTIQFDSIYLSNICYVPGTLLSVGSQEDV